MSERDRELRRQAEAKCDQLRKELEHKKRLLAQAAMDANRLRAEAGTGEAVVCPDAPVYVMLTRLASLICVDKIDYIDFEDPDDDTPGRIEVYLTGRVMPFVCNYSLRDLYHQDKLRLVNATRYRVGEMPYIELPEV